MSCGYDTDYLWPNYFYYFPKDTGKILPEKHWNYKLFTKGLFNGKSTRPYKYLMKHRTQAHKYHKILLIGDRYGEIINEWGVIPPHFRSPHSWSDAVEHLPS